jgi:arylsulfatase A-like enzyme
VRRHSAAAVVLAALLLAPMGCRTTPTAVPAAAARNQTRVMLIGLDGATWDLIDALIKQGKLPNLARLVGEGTRARLTSTSVMQLKSPLIWTTIATGKRWQEHGIEGFDVDGRPVASNMRRTKALWNILSEHGRTVGTIAYLVTWPTEQVNGFMISERAYYEGDLQGATYPEHVLDGYGQFWAWKPDSEENAQRMKRFMDFDFDRAYYEPIKHDPARVARLLEAYRRDPARHVKFMSHFLVDNRLNFYFPKDESVARLAEHFLTTRPVDFFAVYLQGIDIVSHGFWKFMLPQGFDVTPREIARFGEVIPRYYEYIDEKVGQIVRHADEHTVIIICSDHGFTSWHADAGEKYWYLSGNHTREGMLLMAGPQIRRGATLPDASVYDLAPTVLYLMGLPGGADMDGQVLAAAIAPAYLVRHPIRFISTYEGNGTRGDEHPLESPVDADEMERLRALGYVR